MWWLPTMCTLSHAVAWLVYEASQTNVTFVAVVSIMMHKEKKHW